MAWNEPGGGKDPWGSNDNQGPPDLDEIWKKFRDRFGGGRRGGGKTNGSDGGNGAGGLSLGLIAIVALVVWAVSGVYILEPAERGVELQFGAYVRTTGPGPHWIPRLIRTVEKVDVDKVHSVDNKSAMLTQDENIVDIDLEVQYRIRDPEDYLFNVRQPDETLLQATRSALREVAGKSKMEFLLTEGREDLVISTQELLQTMLDEYVSGLLVTSINLQDAQPPENVQAAFDDVIKAREDKERAEELAEAYANDIVPRARGQAAREIAEANAYRERVVARAQGEAQRFEQLLVEYKKAPRVTRERLYLDTMQRVLSSSSKVLIDAGSSSPLLYLPLDELMKRSGSSTAATDPSGGVYNSGGTSPSTRMEPKSMTDPARDRARGR